jgi:hypothetical protein
MHLALGMYGKVIIYPSDSSPRIYDNGPTYDRQYEYLFSELDQRWNADYTTIGSFLSYEPNIFLMNGKNRSLLYSDSTMTMHGAVGDQLLMRFLNVGYRATRVIFPPEVTAVVHTSDGRVLSSSFETDTLMVYPGERYNVLLEINDASESYVTVDYLSPYRMQFLGREYIPLNDSSFSYIPHNETDTFSDTLGLAVEKVEVSNLRIYPVPSSGKLSIEANEFLSFDYRIYNIQGVQLQSGSESGQLVELNIDALPKGAYILQLSLGEGGFSSFIFTVVE